MTSTGHEQWVRSVLGIVGDVPAYGSPEFDELPADSAMRAVATVLAAEVLREQSAEEHLAFLLHLTLQRAQEEVVDDEEDDGETEEERQARWDEVRARAARPGPGLRRLFVRREDYVNAARMADQSERIDRWLADNPWPEQYPTVTGEGRDLPAVPEPSLQRLAGPVVAALRARRA